MSDELITEGAKQVLPHVATGGGSILSMLGLQWLIGRRNTAAEEAERQQEAAWRENVSKTLAAIESGLKVNDNDRKHDLTERARVEAVIMRLEERQTKLELKFERLSAQCGVKHHAEGIDG